MSLREVFEAGDRLSSLRALRDRLATDLDATESARDSAALSQRLMDVLGQIADVEKAIPAAKGTALDELAKRRTTAKPAARGSRTSSSRE